VLLLASFVSIGALTPRWRLVVPACAACATLYIWFVSLEAMVRYGILSSLS
jgi:hypothetical protein